jgi:Kdo2-lipid IVA lauroyltransferase/acyltransferase
MMARLAVGLVWMLHWLPLAALARVGESLGMLFYAFGHERRRVCLINLERCLPALPEAERVALAKRHFRVMGRSLLERGILWWAPRERIVRLVRVSGIEHIQALSGTPVILLAPHFAGVDGGFTRLTCEMDLTGLYSRQKNAVFDRLLLWGRTRFGHQRAYSRQDGVRPLLAALKQGLPCFYQPDQDYGPRDAVFVPFFGVPAATITGVSRLARLAGARVVPCVTRMHPEGGGYEVIFYPAWTDFPTDDVVADTRRMNAFVEARVREMPEQYLWTHKRFKTRPAGEPKWY